MKKAIALIITVLMVASMLAMVVSAAPRTAEIKRGTPVIDGKIDEIWDYADELPMDRQSIVGNASATAYAKMLWDDGNIYILVVVNDPTKSDQTEVLYTEDCLEIFFDLDNKKTDGYTEKNQFRFLYDIVSPLGIRNPDNISADYATYLTLSGSEPDSKTFIYEIAVNEKIGTDLKFAAGKEIGIEFGFDDNTQNDNTRTAALSWNSEGIDPSTATSALGTVKLIDEEAFVIEEVDDEVEAEAADTAAAEAPKAAKTADAGAVVLAMLAVSMSGIVLLKKNGCRI